MAYKQAGTGKLPAYKQIRLELVTEIDQRNPAPNSPYYSEKDIIERFGVSRVTVRQALELMEQDGYIYRVQGKGTFIGSLETKPAKTVAFVATCILKNEGEAVLLRSVEDTLNRQNYNLIICNTNNDFIKTERYLRRLIKARIDAIIYICAAAEGDYARNAQLVNYIVNSEVPCVMLDRMVEPTAQPVYAVTADNARGAAQLTEHLIALGHTRIGFCAAEESSSTRERLEGYRQCLAAHGLPAPRDYVKHMHSPDEHQVVAMQYMMLAERPTAIVAAHDPMALGLKEGFTALGVKVPGEMAIVGFEDSGAGPSALTMWRVPLWEMGKLAASLAADLLQGKAVAPCQIRIPGELVIRDGCGVKCAGRTAGRQPASVN